MQTGSCPDHSLLARQVLVSLPTSLYPLLQVYVAVLPNLVSGFIDTAPLAM